MLVKDLPDDTLTKDVKVIIPDEALKAFQNYFGGERVMYIVGSIMGSLMFSPLPPETKERWLYPLPMDVDPSEILDWEVQII